MSQVLSDEDVDPNQREDGYTKCVSKENDYRLFFEKFASSSWGKGLFKIMGFMALITSLIATGNTYSQFPFWYEQQWFNKLDRITCIGFCIQWCFKLYVSSPRNIYLRSTDSFLDLVVFLPLLLVPEPNPMELSYSCITISRFVRIVMFTNMLTKYY